MYVFLLKPTLLALPIRTHDGLTKEPDLTYFKKKKHQHSSGQQGYVHTF